MLFRPMARSTTSTTGRSGCVVRSDRGGGVRIHGPRRAWCSLGEGIAFHGVRTEKRLWPAALDFQGGAGLE